jgi:hypothetical protein
MLVFGPPYCRCHSDVWRHLVWLALAVTSHFSGVAPLYNRNIRRWHVKSDYKNYVNYMGCVIVIVICGYFIVLTCRGHVYLDTVCCVLSIQSHIVFTHLLQHNGHVSLKDCLACRNLSIPPDAKMSKNALRYSSGIVVFKKSFHGKHSMLFRPMLHDGWRLQTALPSDVCLTAPLTKMLAWR